MQQRDAAIQKCGRPASRCSARRHERRGAFPECRQKDSLCRKRDLGDCLFVDALLTTLVLDWLERAARDVLFIGAQFSTHCSVRVPHLMILIASRTRLYADVGDIIVDYQIVSGVWFGQDRGRGVQGGVY